MFSFKYTKEKLGFSTSVSNTDKPLCFFHKNTYYLLVKALVMAKIKEAKIQESRI